MIVLNKSEFIYEFHEMCFNYGNDNILLMKTNERPRVRKIELHSLYLDENWKC